MVKAWHTTIAAQHNPNLLYKNRCVFVFSAVFKYIKYHVLGCLFENEINCAQNVDILRLQDFEGNTSGAQTGFRGWKGLEDRYSLKKTKICFKSK